MFVNNSTNYFFKGIKPKKLTWEESVSNEIYDKIIDTIDSSSYWQVYAVRSSSNDAHELGLNTYEVLLFTDEGQVNSAIVKLDLAITDKDTNHFLELGNLMDGDEDIEFDLEMGMEEMTKSLGIPKEILEKAVADAKVQKLKAAEAKITEIKDEKKIVEVEETQKVIPKVRKEKILAEKLYKPVLPKAPEKYRLKTIPSPRTTWYQTRHSIILTIAAPDLVDYELKVTDSMVIFAYMLEGELKLLELHLLASIESKKTTTKIRGVTFHMTLLKAVPLMWPRLTFSSDKFTWLHYHFDKLQDKFEGTSKKKRLQEIEKAVDDDHIDEEDSEGEDVYFRRENQGVFKRVNHDNDERIKDAFDRHLNDEFDPLDDGF